MPNTFTVTIKSNSREYWATIECLDNAVIDRWYQSAKQIYENPTTIDLMHYPIYYPKKTETSLEIVNNTYTELLSAISDLEKIGVKWPNEEPKEFNYDQQWCNRVHRYFTTLMQYRRFQMDSEVVIDENDNNISEFNRLGHVINSCVHRIELYCTNSIREKYFKFNKMFQIKLPNFNFQLSKTHKWHEFNREDYQHHTWQSDCDVIFNAEILGKTILCSFLDQDNPDYFDSSGHHGWFGSFLILTNDARQRLYNSDDFNNWLKKYGKTKESENVYGDFPIGKIIATSTPDFRTLEAIAPASICKIDFHN